VHVLVICPFAHNPTHHWAYSRDLALALIDERIDCEIVLSRPPVLDIEERLLSRCRTFGHRASDDTRTSIPSSSSRNYETFRTILLATRLSRRHSVRHVIDGTHLLVGLWALLGRRPTVYNVWGPPSPTAGVGFVRSLGRLLAARLMRRASQSGRLIFIAETDSIAQAWSGIADDRVLVIPHAIREPQLQITQSEAKARLHLPIAQQTLLIFGPERRGKDYGLVFEAAKLTRTRPHLLFVGRRASNEDPGEWATQHGYEECTFIDRFVTEEEAAMAFSACDAVLLPYPSGYEKGSGVLLQACRFSKPVLATDTVYLRRFVTEFGCGILFRPGDPLHCAEAMDLLQNADLYGEFVGGTGRAREKFPWSSVIHDYIAAYGKF
jgi:glycosyltransferase involved in cell wall biosynthesis